MASQQQVLIYRQDTHFSYLLCFCLWLGMQVYLEMIKLNQIDWPSLLHSIQRHSIWATVWTLGSRFGLPITPRYTCVQLELPKPDSKVGSNEQ